MSIQSLVSLSYTFCFRFPISQDVARQVFQIMEENRPLVECTFVFGETTVHCVSQFNFEDIQIVIQKCTDIMLATMDPHANIKVNGCLVLGILLPAALIEPEFAEDVWEIVPGMHHSIVEIMEWDQSAFLLGNDRWEISIHFQFGSQHVAFESNFDSHLVPQALSTARDICDTLGFWDLTSQGTLIEPLQDPYALERVHIPFTAANFPMHFY